jgi:hypothetical protein
VRAGGNRSADRDVRQRCEVRQRDAVLVQRAAERSVANARLDGHCCLADLDDAVEVLRREQSAVAAGVADEAE